MPSRAPSGRWLGTLDFTKSYDGGVAAASPGVAKVKAGRGEAIGVVGGQTVT